MAKTHDFDTKRLFDMWMAAAEYALAHNRTYALGGEDVVNGVDCSGLALWILSRCGFSTSRLATNFTVKDPFHVDGAPRLLAPEICKLLFTRPLNWQEQNSTVLERTAGPTGPDSRFGAYKDMFRVYYYNSTPELDHIAIGFGREYIIESTSAVFGTTYDIETTRNADGSEHWHTVADLRTGVRVRHSSELATGFPVGYTNPLWLDFDAYQTYFSGNGDRKSVV